MLIQSKTTLFINHNIANESHRCVADLPCIFSGQGIGLLDPHELYFKNGRYPTSSHLWNLIFDRDEMARLSDQFSPYLQDLFGATQQVFQDGSFHGTLFRFPFRAEGMQSDLCKTTYDANRARSLFAALEADAHSIALFLNNVEQIEVYEKLESDLPPVKTLSLKIATDRRVIPLRKRDRFLSTVTRRSTEPASVSYTASTDVVDLQTARVSEQKNWVISHHYGGQEDLNTANKIGASLGLLPWVAVAVPLQSATERPLYSIPPEGHVFCFLPLPRDSESSTGFKFHVHGYFAVDQNRRHIKKRTVEQYETIVTDKEVLWNEYLINKLLPKALANALMHVTKLTNANMSSDDIICSSIPDRRHVKQEWKPFAEAFLQELPHLALFRSRMKRGQYSKASDVLFDNIEDERSTTQLIRRILHQNATELASVPLYVLEQLGEAASKVTAPVVCSALKNVDSSSQLTDFDRMNLLKYFVSNSSSKAQDIIGTMLLPLGDGTWVTFESCTMSKIYVDSVEHPRTLLPTLDRKFVSADALEICQALANEGK